MLSRRELVDLVLGLVVRVGDLEVENQRLSAELAALKAEVTKNSGNSSKPPSRDPVAERARQASERRERRAKAAGGKRRRPGKQPGAPGTTLQMTDHPDEIVTHSPDHCGGCGTGLGEAEVTSTEARQVTDLPKVRPTVTEHRAETRRCACCGAETTAEFPDEARSPVCYGPGVRAVVCYLLCRQHIPIQRCAEAMRDLFGTDISTGAIDAIYAEASRRLGGFIAGLVALLRSLPVLHADETTDRIGTTNCWMHVISTATYTLIHASATRGFQAVRDAGVLIGYRGVVVHDRLALYWKLKSARHGVCAAHLLRDLASVAAIPTQAAWARDLAGLLVEINNACGDARARGLKALSPRLRSSFTARYDTIVAEALAANPDPGPETKRSRLERQSHNLAVAFSTHKRPILTYMHNLGVSMSNNQAERDLRPVKLHRKISSCFKSQAGADRFARVRSYLSTTQKNDVPALEALTRLFNGDPWMPPRPQAA
ncbi:MAG: IS66 family transposase [Acidimicrobiales bacterium]